MKFLNRIVLGDALKTLKHLPDDSIDLLCTDPPYHLSDTEPLEKRIDKLFSSFNNVIFPNFNKGNLQIRKYSELVRVLSRSSNLRRFKSGDVGIESWIGVPESAVDFESDVKVRQIKINTSAESFGFRVSDGVLVDETDIEKGEFIGDFIFDFGDSFDFSSSNLKGSDFGKFLSGFFTLPISAVLSPSFPTFEGRQSFVSNGTDFMEDIRLGDNSSCQTQRAPFILTDWRAKNGWMLRFDLRGRSAELFIADSTEKGKLLNFSSSAKLVRTFSGTSCLSTMFKPLTVGFVCNIADKTKSFYFHLWVPDAFSIPSVYKKVKGFMGKEWDVMPSVDLWKECFRVMKPGAFGFVMCIPRQDCLARMIVNLEDAGFNMNFTSIYWTFATGFPKAMKISKAVDKKLGVKRKVVGQRQDILIKQTKDFERGYRKIKDSYDSGAPDRNNGFKTISADIIASVSNQAKELDGSYAGFQPKPAVEIILVVMKPIETKTYVEQAMKNGKGVTWLDSCRIPKPEGDRTEYGVDGDEKSSTGNENTVAYGKYKRVAYNPAEEGRFPANLLVSDDVLNDGNITVGSGGNKSGKTGLFNTATEVKPIVRLKDTGSFSRYFDIDIWFENKLQEFPESMRKTFPFLIVPKASKSERNKGCENGNSHCTTKPLKLMSYLVTLGSREGDIVLDPFIGSGTTAMAAKMLKRNYIGIDNDRDSCVIACKRIKVVG